MQALAILLAVAATSVESSGNTPSPLGLPRAAAGVSLPTRANWDSFPTRDRRAPSPPTGIQARAPLNSDNEIQPVDYESEGLPDDPAAPTPLPSSSSLGDYRPGNSLFPTDPAASTRRRGLADTETRNINGSENENLGHTRAESRRDEGRRQESAAELKPVPGQQPPERDPYAVPDLRGQSASRSREDVGRSLPVEGLGDAFDLPAGGPMSPSDGPARGQSDDTHDRARAPLAPVTPAVRRGPLDVYSPRNVNDPGSTRRDNSLLPSEFDASASSRRPSGGRRPAAVKQDHRFTPSNSLSPGGNRGAAAATSVAAAQTPGGNLQRRETPNSGATRPAAPTQRQVASPYAVSQPPPTNQADGVHPGGVHPGAVGGPVGQSVVYPPPRQQVPANPRTQYEERPWAPFFATLLALFASGGLNLYLGWIAWDTYNRYQELVADMRHETRQRERQRDRDRVRDKVMTTGAADYSF